MHCDLYLHFMWIRRTRGRDRNHKPKVLSRRDRDACLLLPLPLVPARRRALSGGLLLLWLLLQATRMLLVLLLLLLLLLLLVLQKRQLLFTKGPYSKSSTVCRGPDQGTARFGDVFEPHGPSQTWCQLLL